MITISRTALDVARVLARSAEEIAATDVPDWVVTALRCSRITDFYLLCRRLLCRRGPAQMKFTPVELRGLGELSNADLIIDPTELALSESERAELAGRPQLERMVSTLRQWADRPLQGKPRRMHLRFLRSPVAFLGGRLVDGHGHILPGEYVTGWAKRGPSGVIGTNRADAAQTVKNLLADLPDLAPPRRDDDRTVIELLEHRGVKIVDWAGWLRLDSHEIQAGRRRGSPRVKTPDLAAMLDRTQPLAHEDPTDDGANTPSPAGRTSG